MFCSSYLPIPDANKLKHSTYMSLRAVDYYSTDEYDEYPAWERRRPIHTKKVSPSQMTCACKQIDADIPSKPSKPDPSLRKLNEFITNLLESSYLLRTLNTLIGSASSRCKKQNKHNLQRRIVAPRKKTIRTEIKKF